MESIQKENGLVPLKKRLIGVTKQVVKMVEKLVSGKKTHSIVTEINKRGIRVSEKSGCQSNLFLIGRNPSLERS